MTLTIFKVSKNIIVKTSIKLTLFIFCLTSFTIYSQNTKEIKADKAFDNYNYISAIKNYEKLIETGNKSQDILQKLGNAYYFKADLVNAAKWYGELF